MSNSLPARPTSAIPPVAVIGAGPAGLMAAEQLALAGFVVDVYDAKATVGRKFLLAGKGGLNLTHAEELPTFLSRYGEQASEVACWMEAFPPQALRDWALELGITTFVGTSGRVFPQDMKAAPLLRAWLHRLRGKSVRFHMRHRWTGWSDDGALRFEAPLGTVETSPAATVLALGGASWPQLGSDGSWWPWLAQRGVSLAPLRPANCGFDVGWSPHFSTRFAGEPLKTVAFTVGNWRQVGECVVTATGLEGSLVYAASARLRDTLEATGQATVLIDLLPDRNLLWVEREVAHPRGPRSLATHLKSRLNLAGVKAGLVWECVPRDEQADPSRLAARLKALPVTFTAARPLQEAISSAGGVHLQALDERLMLRALPGVFCAGEMLDWEAPTGGYLLSACFASGRVAGRGAGDWLRRLPSAA